MKSEAPLSPNATDGKSNLGVEHGSGVFTVRLPCPGIRHLPYLLKLQLVVAGFVILLNLASRSMWPLLVLIAVLLGLNVFIHGMTRTEWRVQNGRLSVRRCSWRAGRSWPVSAVGEVKRAPEDAGFIVRITGMDIVEVQCGADRQTLEAAAALLNEALTAAKEASLAHGPTAPHPDSNLPAR